MVIAGSRPMAMATCSGLSSASCPLRNCIVCRHSLRLKPNSRGPLTCIRLYDRLPRPETGSLLTVTPPVMNGPPSPAAWIGIGSVRMSTASPVTHVRFPGGVGDPHGLDRVGRIERAAHHLDHLPLRTAQRQRGARLVGDRGREDRPRGHRPAAPVGCGRVLEQRRRAALPLQCGGHVGQLVVERHRPRDARQLPGGFQYFQIGA